MKQIIALVLFAACLLPSGYAIRCYQCKSLTDANCAKDVIDANSNIHSVDCDVVPKPNTLDQLLPVTKCNKVVTSDKAGMIISRDCHFEIVGQKNDVCTVSHSREVQSCHICKGDLCNASSAGRFMAIGLVALLSMVAMQFVL
ncbi:uncharacterized protein LOC105220295 [Zeugodacus cucurbitae]|uniref:Secreted Ly-6/uPAR-related protein 1 n=1 Tax=Zeugodacus cucurbitae TaxID=28588 RepID=A0A0A1XBQ5_ZEUCU|nr:uncharacterized protein LOC105220295 [Zeugodacus cucurbitae]